MTSAVDIIAPKPAARPEPAAKDNSRDEDRVSFADALDTETSKTEAAPAKEAALREADASDEPATPDTNAAAQPVQPQQPQVTPAVNSPQAILAGLTQAAATDAPTTEAGAAVPAIDPAAAAAAAGAAQATAKPAASPAAAPQGAPKPAAPQADASAEDSDSATSPTDAAQKSAALAQAAAASATTTPAPITLTAPTIAPVADEAAPLSAPGEERATAVETTTASTTKPASATNAAADPAASKAQGVQAKTTQVATAATTEAAPDIKADTAAPAPTTTVDALASTRTATETARAAAANPAMQNAPATTVQVYQRMVERFDGRAQRYEIRLDPAELGRVDVRIEVGADKKVHAVLAAHDSAALTDLMRGQRSLERALSDAGIDVAKDGIRFELASDQGRNPANNFNDKDGNARSANVWRGFNTVDVAVDAQTAAAARPWRSSARLDVVA